jgi:DNA-binding transcriptional regulator YbjK
MGMLSHLIREQRRLPCQKRGERRVTDLLDAAASVIAISGYDATTMSAIANWADAPSGSLCQFLSMRSYSSV